jgi:hypothetical protein
MKGIYSITNKLNGHRYVGSSINISRRKTEHFNLLRKGVHHSQYLQNAWNKYGESMFIFSSLEFVEDISILIEREQWWIDNTPCEYNASTIAGNSGIGAENSNSVCCFQYSLEGVFLKKWQCVMDIERQIGLANSLIVRCLKGKTRTAHKFQWFYEFKGSKIEPIQIKSCKNGTRNLKILEKFIELFKQYPEKPLTFFANELNKNLSFIKNMFNKHKEIIQGNKKRKRTENTEELKFIRRKAQEKSVKMRKQKLD